MRASLRPFPSLLFCALFLGFAALVAPVNATPCSTDYNNFNGPVSLYLNVQNCGTLCADQSLPFLAQFRDGISGLRINPVSPATASPPSNAFYRVSQDDPLLRGVLDLFGGENLLILVDDGVDQGEFAKPTPEQMALKLRSTLTTHPRVRRIQFMNEPSNFSDITPEEYVLDYLPLARQIIDEANRNRGPAQQIVLYATGWFGNGDGFRETQRMVEAGALALVDAVSAHIYRERVAEARDLADDYARLVRGTPVALTETNFIRGSNSRHDTQETWICSAMTVMERVLRRTLQPNQLDLQINVLYTLQGDSARNFNLLAFDNPSAPTLWRATGPGQPILQERSVIPTDRNLQPIDDCDLDPNPSICCTMSIGHPQYCTLCGPCSVDQGDCDNDSECQAGLSCINNIGADFGFRPGVDVCQRSNIQQTDCPRPPGHPHFCRDCGPCFASEGDCDGDEQCRPGLICASDVGADFGFTPNIDVCMAPPEQ